MNTEAYGNVFEINVHITTSYNYITTLLLENWLSISFLQFLKVHTIPSQKVLPTTSPSPRQLMTAVNIWQALEWHTPADSCWAGTTSLSDYISWCLRTLFGRGKTSATWRQELGDTGSGEHHKLGHVIDTQRHGTLVIYIITSYTWKLHLQVHLYNNFSE